MIAHSQRRTQPRFTGLHRLHTREEGGSHVSVRQSEIHSSELPTDAAEFLRRTRTHLTITQNHSEFAQDRSDSPRIAQNQTFRGTHKLSESAKHMFRIAQNLQNTSSESLRIKSRVGANRSDILRINSKVLRITQNQRSVGVDTRKRITQNQLGFVVHDLRIPQNQRSVGVTTNSESQSTQKSFRIHSEPLGTTQTGWYDHSNT
jgi:hypothetical protein